MDNDESQSLRGIPTHTPNAAITVDEQQRTKLTQYISYKPAKCRIKVWWVCDSTTNYPLKGTIYNRKLPNAERKINQRKRVVLNLVKKYQNSGRIVCCDNLFPSLDLAKTLTQKLLAISMLFAK